MKKGFTIVELMLVVGVITVLMGIVTTAAAQSIRAARGRRADALCALVQAGMNAYYARYDKWPGTVGGLIASGQIDTRGNQEAADRTSDDAQYVLNGTEVKSCMLDLIEETKRGTPVMDISGLFVSTAEGEMSGNRVRKAQGLDFMSAIHGTRTSPEKMKTVKMFFGYPDPQTGYFLRFKMVYSIPTDQFTVSKQR